LALLKKVVMACAALCCLTVVAQTQTKPATWLTLPQQDLLYLDTDQGTLVILLASQFAPQHVDRVKKLVKAGFYDGVSFYRVIEGFVAQFGVPEHEWGNRAVLEPMKAEFSWPIRSADNYLLVQKPDLLAEETGFNQGFAVAREKGQEWLVHCAGVVNLARANEPDSGVADLAIMMGQAPRHLDKNMSALGKVVWGLGALNRVRRGDPEQGGVLTNASQRSVIKTARLGSDLPVTKQLALEWMNTSSSEFAQSLAERRSRTHAFYQYKGNGNLDICYPQVLVRLMKSVD